MKILHIISDTVLGGAQKVCIDLANAAIEDNNEVAVAAMAGGYLWNQLNAKVTQFQLKYMKKSINLNDFKVIGELKKIRKEYKPDIIHLHTSKPGILGRWVFRKEKNHVVYTVHGFDQIRIAHRKFLLIEKLFQKYAGAIVAVSEYDKKNMEQTKIINNLKLVYNGIDTSTIKPLKEFPVPIKESKIVLTIARIAPPKDMALFTEVARDFADKDTAFVWVGGTKGESLDSVKAEYNMPANVYLLGDIPNASNLINLCDVFVLFSKHEGLPMSIIEALSQKKVVVASNVGGIPELLTEDIGAVIDSKNDAVEVISQLLNDKDKCLLMGEKALEKYNANFTLSKMWNEYKTIYGEMIK